MAELMQNITLEKYTNIQQVSVSITSSTSTGLAVIHKVSTLKGIIHAKKNTTTVTNIVTTCFLERSIDALSVAAAATTYKKEIVAIKPWYVEGALLVCFKWVTDGHKRIGIEQASLSTLLRCTVYLGFCYPYKKITRITTNTNTVVGALLLHNPRQFYLFLGQKKQRKWLYINIFECKVKSRAQSSALYHIKVPYIYHK